MVNADDLVGVGKTLSTLIEKVSEHLNAAWEPSRIVKRAKAEVEADRIKTIGEIERGELLRRAEARDEARTIRRQINLEQVLRGAAVLLEGMTIPPGIAQSRLDCGSGS